MTVIITLAWKNASGISEKAIGVEAVATDQAAEGNVEVAAESQSSSSNNYQNSVEQGLKIARRVMWTSGIIPKLRKNRYNISPSKTRFLEKLQRQQKIYRNQRNRSKLTARNNQV